MRGEYLRAWHHCRISISRHFDSRPSAPRGCVQARLVLGLFHLADLGLCFNICSVGNEVVKNVFHCHVFRGKGAAAQWAGRAGRMFRAGWDSSQGLCGSRFAVAPRITSFVCSFSQFLAIASKPAYLLAVAPYSRRICFFVEVIVFAHTASNVHLQLHGAIENSGERILLVSAFECSRGTSSCF